MTSVFPLIVLEKPQLCCSENDVMLEYDMGQGLLYVKEITISH
jgi:hypothetical protein